MVEHGIALLGMLKVVKKVILINSGVMATQNKHVFSPWKIDFYSQLVIKNVSDFRKLLSEQQ